MSEHPDCALVRRGYEAFGKGDLETMSTLLTADVIHHVPGNNPMSGHHKGRENVLDFYRRLRRGDEGHVPGPPGVGSGGRAGARDEFPHGAR